MVPKAEPIRIADGRERCSPVSPFAKYANATQGEISLHNFDNYITIDVKDNGKGFQLKNIGPASHGLAGMRHRVEATGGKLTVISTEGSGTHIGAMLPKTM